jgi:maleate isomerase
MQSLLDATAASRTTLRLDWRPWGAHVDDVFAEAREPGIESLVGKTSIRQREAETVKWLERTRCVLVQGDCAAESPAPPPALLDIYGVRAQMLAPLVVNETLVGWISVHENSSPRKWTPEDIQALENAAAAVTNTLDEENARSSSCDCFGEELGA